MLIDCKKRVVVQNKSNLLLKIILFNTGSLQIFTIDVIEMYWKLFTKDNKKFPCLSKLDLGRRKI